MIDKRIERAKRGDQNAIAELFAQHRQRLKTIIEIRMDPRLAGRVDPSDVLQETYIDVNNLIHEFRDGDLPFFLWLRLKVGHRLSYLHRYHLATQKRTAFREISLVTGPMPAASSISLASQLMGRITTASNAAIRAETRLRLQEALNKMSEIDREVLVLRHFEDLTNIETAQVLKISQTAASNRYIRALKKLKDVMTPIE
ncbi:MAG: sigma-70 family RNA polymerase sigma factor [Planctomycetota bacterium]